MCRGFDPLLRYQSTSKEFLAGFFIAFFQTIGYIAFGENNMNKILQILFLLICSACSTQTTTEPEVFFSPSRKCEDGLIHLIEGADKTIDAAVYSINNKNLVNAIKKAHDRGIQIRILTDRTQAAGKSSKVKELHDYGINIRTHSKYKIEHNKFAVFDGKQASTGSYNWTTPATKKNSENCVFFTNDEAVIQDYQKRFDYLWRVNTKKASDTWFDKHQSSN